MEIKNRRIVKASESELFSYWLSRGYDDVYDFPTFKSLCEEQGEDAHHGRK